MSVAKHLNLTPDQYDERIRTLIPHYDELIAQTGNSLHLSARRIESIVDLGIGTGALARACLEVVPRARIWGIDIDEAMMALAPERLGRHGARVELVHGDFSEAAVPSCDAIVASYALHHIRQAKAKQRFYRRCFEAIRPGGIFVSGDCAPSAVASAFARDLEVWFTHLGRTFGRAKGKKVYESWAEEDVYLPLSQEIRMLERAGFVVEVPWRRTPFAVMVGLKPSSGPKA